MGLEVAKSAVFIDRNLLEINARRINVRAGDANALVDWLGTDLKQEEVLVAVDIVEFVACFHLVADGVGLVACGLCDLDALFDDLALGFALVEEGLVGFCVGVCGVDDFFTGFFVDGFLFVGEGILLFHGGSPFRFYR